MARKSGSDRKRKAALQKALRAMWERLQARATPERLSSVLDQLEEPARDKAPRKKSG